MKLAIDSDMIIDAFPCLSKVLLRGLGDDKQFFH